MAALAVVALCAYRWAGHWVKPKAMPTWSIIHAPTPLGLRAPAPGVVPGTKAMPRVLREAGLHDALGATFRGEVRPAPYDPERDPVHGILNPHAIRDFSERLATRVGDVMAKGESPLVLGGDCSVLLGCAVALRRQGRFGLAFLDGHPDYLTPEISRTGGVAGMDLAMVTGTGPALLTDIGGLGPYLNEEDVVQIGSRDQEGSGADREGRLPGTKIRMIELAEVRSLGPRAAAEVALERISRHTRGLWIHLDADVLDDQVMPAVDSRQEDGLSYDELETVVASLLGSDRVVGMDVTIYDPDLDPTGEIGRRFCRALGRMLGGGGEAPSASGGVTRE